MASGILLRNRTLPYSRRPSVDTAAHRAVLVAHVATVKEGRSCVGRGGAAGSASESCNYPGHVRLDVVRPPQSLNRVLRHPGRARHAAHRPARPALGRLGRAAGDPLAHLGADARLTPPAPGVREARHPRCAEATFPLDDHRAADAQRPCGGRLADAVGALQHDRRALMFPVRRGRSLRQRLARPRRDVQCRGRTWHAGPMPASTRYVN